MLLRPAPAILSLVLIFGGGFVIASSGPDENCAPPSDRHQSFEKDGLSIDAEIVPLGAAASRPELRPGDEVEIRFTITDTTTGTPLTGLSPAGWIDPIARDDEEDASTRIASYLTGSISARAAVDLNVFHVLALNPDGTISVVDPLFGYGGSRLLDRVLLPSPGEDWVLSADGSTLWVSCPRANQVACIDTGTWDVVRSITTPTKPSRLALQPDGNYLWVGCRGVGDGSRARVAVIDTHERALETTLDLGPGAHRFAFSPDAAFAFVATRADDGASVVHALTTADLSIAKRLDVTGSVDGFAFASGNDSVYWVDGTAGEVVAVDRASLEVRTRIPVEKGVTELFVDPSGTRGLILDPTRDSIHVLSIARDQIVQSGEIGPSPDQIAFTETLAYVRCAGSETVWMLPLANLGVEGPIAMVDFPGGDVPFGLGKSPSLAAGICAAPSGSAVLVANPVDQAIYYYSEGMAAPMGEFGNYGQEPSAVLVVDRSLQERAPGVYSTQVPLATGGPTGLYFLLDYPATTTHFVFDVAPAVVPVTVADRTAVTMRAVGEESPTVGVPCTVEIVVLDEEGAPLSGLEDVAMMAMQSSVWQVRGLASADPEANGRYLWTFTPTRDGVVFVHARIPSRSLTFTDVPRITLRVAPAKEVSDVGSNR